MRSFSFVVALLFALFTSTYAFPELMLLEARKGNNGTSKAQGGGKNKTSKAVDPTVKACNKMAQLTKLTKLASNQTKLNDLEDKGKLTADEVTKLMAKAANATSELQTMMSNQTLMTTCAVVDAHEKVVGQCKQMNELTKMSKLAANTTALDAYLAKAEAKNATKAEKLKERIANSTSKLQKLQSNSTLMTLCADQQKAQASSSGTQAQSTSAAKGAAAALTIQSMPYLFVPMLGAVFALFL